MDNQRLLLKARIKRYSLPYVRSRREEGGLWERNEAKGGEYYSQLGLDENFVRVIWKFVYGLYHFLFSRHYAVIILKLGNSIRLNYTHLVFIGLKRVSSLGFICRHVLKTPVSALSYRWPEDTGQLF